MGISQKKEEKYLQLCFQIKIFKSFEALSEQFYGFLFHFFSPRHKITKERNGRRGREREKKEHETKRGEDRPIPSRLELEGTICVSIHKSGNFLSKSHIILVDKSFSIEKQC